MMSVYKKAVRQTEQIRWKIQIHKYKIRSEYTEFHTDQIENMLTKAPRTRELGAFAKKNCNYNKHLTHIVSENTDVMTKLDNVQTGIYEKQTTTIIEIKMFGTFVIAHHSQRWEYCFGNPVIH